jgi:tRNA1Val (adenine37-N6)-methyltransferase
MSFKFKHFKIEDDISSMKVGTDAVLLGAWASHDAPSDILDIGTGSGLIALMMAQRFQEARILGLDIHEASIKQAINNFRHSPWESRLSALHISLQEFVNSTSRAYDLIVSNPPFFSDSLLPPDPRKALAKHNRHLSLVEMAKCVRALLNPDGLFSLILPAKLSHDFNTIAKQSGLYMVRDLSIIPVTGKIPNRTISTWSLQHEEMEAHSLTIRLDPRHYTQEYIALTKDFYLAL